MSSTPDPAPSPAQLISERLLAKYGKQVDLAEQLGIKRQALNMVMRGRRPITTSLAMKLAAASGDPPDYWLDVQAAWEEWCQTPAAQAALEQARHVEDVEEWNRRGSFLLTDSQIVEARTFGLLGISPFTEDNLNPASYDLTLTAPCLVKKGARPRPLPLHQGCYELPPGKFLLCRAQETLKLSPQIAGRLGQTTDLIEQGIVITLGLQVDPGYEGPIFFGIENRTGDAVEIGATEGCVSVEFHFLAHPPTLTEVDHAGSGRPTESFARINSVYHNGAASRPPAPDRARSPGAA